MPREVCTARVASRTYGDQPQPGTSWRHHYPGIYKVGTGLTQCEMFMGETQAAGASRTIQHRICWFGTRATRIWLSTTAEWTTPRSIPRHHRLSRLGSKYTRPAVHCPDARKPPARGGVPPRDGDIHGRIGGMDCTMMRWGAVIPTRNNHSSIEAAIQSPLDQAISPKRVATVGDGSTDGADEVLDGIRDSYLPVLLNKAPAHLPYKIDYHTVLAGDVRFSDNYVERVTDWMQDSGLAVASSRISRKDRGLQGAGRLVEHRRFRQHYPNGYVRRVGVESEISYRAMYTGHSASIVEVPPYHDNGLGRHHNFAGWMAGMRSAGYYLWRLVLASWYLARRHSNCGAYSFIKSYITLKPNGEYHPYWNGDIRQYTHGQEGPCMTFRRWCFRQGGRR